MRTFSSPDSLFRFVILLCLFGSASITQAQIFEWVKSFGAVDRTIAYDLLVDPEANVITIGTFSDKVDFDPGPNDFTMVAKGSRAVFISKLDSSGNFIWAKQLATRDYLGIGHMALDDAGNIYLTGGFNDKLDVDPGPDKLIFVPDGALNNYIIKLNPAGELLWARQFGSSSGDPYSSATSGGITVTDNQNIYITGSFIGTIDFDPGSETYNLTVPMANSFTEAVFVQKLDASGNFVWAKSLGGTSPQRTLVHTLATDEASNVYIGGGFYGTQDFDPGPDTCSFSSINEQDVFITKLDSLGNFVWAKQFASRHLSVIEDLAIGRHQTVYSIGWFGGIIDFDPGPDTFMVSGMINTEVFISKLDSSGNMLWTKALVGTNSNRGFGLSLDEQENVYTTGTFRGTTDFDPGPDTVAFSTPIGSDNVFVSKLDADGQYQWAVEIGSLPSDDNATAIGVDRAGNIYTTGTFNYTSDFDPGPDTVLLSPSGIEDAFVHRMRPCISTFADLRVIACENYLSPSGDNIWTSSGNYTDMISNAIGCDSLINIDLIIDNAACIPLGTVEIYANSFGRDLKLYANPTQDSLIIELVGISDEVELSVYNSQDEEIGRFDYPAGQVIKLSFADLAQVVHRLSLQALDNSAQIRLIRE